MKKRQKIELLATYAQKLPAVMYLGNATVSVPEEVKVVWVFRGSEQFIFTLPNKKK